MPRSVTVFDGIRYRDILADREAEFAKRTREGGYSRVGDVLAWGDCHKDGALWRYGYRRAHWWIKPRLSMVRFRPDLQATQDLSRDSGGTYIYDYCNGTITLFYGGGPGVPASQRSFRLEGDRHYTEIISEEIGHG